MLPSLRGYRDEYLLKELYKRWCNHKLMVRWLSRFFNYLDRSVSFGMLLEFLGLSFECEPIFQVLHFAAFAALAQRRRPPAVQRCGCF